MDTPFHNVAIVGLGLIGSSIARAVHERLPATRLSGFDLDPAVRERARALALVDRVAETAAEAAQRADLVILCVPVGAMAAAAEAVASGLSSEALLSDVGSCKAFVAEELRRALPEARIVPAHPVAGTENSGPDAGFAALFQGRWCILTPEEDADPKDVARLAAFWTALGARVERMDARHHDVVLAVTSHLPHLIAFTIVGTASDLERVTEGEVIKYSAGGFRDFTRIAASNPAMWRDIFLTNKEAVLAMLRQFNADLAGLEQAIVAEDGPALFDLFTRTAAIRRGIVEQGQDVGKPDFGRGGG
ncbi:MAG: prephenate/arogenate dehydrogenase family protein [Sphingomonadaceae bacterium]|nr:prephenate/arogenate dehydrogenase family protein [Sphingomonadaceae bacterium]